jgi:Flp pilus assembly protein TadG
MPSFPRRPSISPLALRGAEIQRCDKCLVLSAAAPQPKSKPDWFLGPRLKDERGSALLEFAITLPLLVVFVVGIYDFSGALNQKQKIEQAAQEGAIIAGAQPMSDIATTTADPDSLHPVVTAVLNSLVGSGVVPNGTCTPPGTASGPIGLAWSYTISGCSSAYPTDTLVVKINRGWVPGVAGTANTVGTRLTVTYPYHWRFNSVIQLLFPGSSAYSATTYLTETATIHNQL